MNNKFKKTFTVIICVAVMLLSLLTLASCSKLFNSDDPDSSVDNDAIETPEANEGAATPDPISNVTIHWNLGYDNKVIDIECADESTIIKRQSPVRDGYTFYDWYSNKDFTARVRFPAKAKEGWTAYASWRLKTYDINYVTPFSFNAPALESYNIETSADLPVPLETYGYEFLGWYEDEAFTVPTTKIDSGSFGNKTYYAKTRIKEFSVTYVLNGGENDPANPSHYNKDLSLLALKDATRDGYDFGGWYTSGAYIQKRTHLQGSDLTDSTLYAKWTPINYSIACILNGGFVATENPTSYTINTPDFTLTTPSRDKYSFGGWYSDEQFSSPVSGMIPQNSFGNKVFFAKWNPIVSNVEYVLSGGTNNSQNISQFDITTLSNGENVFTLRAPTREGYRFLYWIVTGTSTLATQIDTSVVGDLSFTAVWVDVLLDYYEFTSLPDGTYKVALNSNGTLPKNRIVEIPSSFANKSISEIADYGFDNLSNIQGVIIPSSVKKIGDYAFRNSIGLNGKTVTLTSVTEIGQYAFNGITLGEIYLPITVKTIGSNAINATTLTCQLSSYRYGWANGVTAANINWEDGWIASGDYKYVLNEGKAYLTKYIGSDAIVTVPNKIDNYDVVSITTAYAGNSNIRYLTLFEGLTELERSSLTCANLNTLQLPVSLTEVEENAFDSSIVCASTLSSKPVGYKATNTLLLNTVLLHTEGYHYRYYVTDGNAAIVRYTGNGATTLPSAATLNATAVTRILSEAYLNKTFTTFSLPEGLVEIESAAFKNCSFTALSMPYEITTIGDNAFSSCSYSKLSVCTIEVNDLNNGSFTRIFGDVTAVTHFVISSATIPAQTFSQMTALEKVTLSPNTTSIGGQAFNNCTKLTDINLDNVTSIASLAFSACSNLDLHLPETLITVGYHAFIGVGIIYCAGDSPAAGWDSSWYDSASAVYFNAADILTENGIQYILIGAEYTVTKITGSGDIVIPNVINSHYVTAIGGGAARKNQEITSVTLNGNVHSIGKYAFFDCGRLTSVSFAGVNSIDDYAFASDSELTTFSITGHVPDSVGKSAFADCEKLTAFDMSSLTTIAERAFYSCSSITTVSIPWLSIIAPYSFFGCSSASTLELYPFLTEIGEFAFYGMSGLAPSTSLTIPSTATSIGDSAFGNVRISSISLACDLSAINAYAFKLCNTVVLMSSATGTELPANSFNGYSYETTAYGNKITFPSTLNKIGDNAFSNSAIKYMSVPSSVISIGSGVFTNCTSLTYLQIGNLGKASSATYKTLLGNGSFPNLSLNIYSYRIIADNAFYGFTGALTISSTGITSVGENAFRGTRLTAFYASNTFAVTIGASAFRDCTSLTSVSLYSVRTLSQYAFSGCTALNNLSITRPNDLNVIEAYAFQNCTSLCSYNLTSSQSSIAAYAFYGSGMTLNCNMPYATKPSGWVTNWSSGATVNWAP